MRTTALIVALLWVTACETSPPRTGPKALPKTGQPALHAVQNARLDELMIEMNSLMFDRMRTELDIDRERRRRAGQIADTAEAMSRTIESVLATLPALNLTPGEQDTFAALANKLRGQAMQLEEQARRNYVDAIPQTLDQMTLTCTACHQLFRDTGP
jgi:cytochrome c556